jgi:hypothetical protein
MKNSTNLFLEKKFARIFEAKDLEQHNENEIRLYKSSPESFTFQIRTYAPIGSFNNKGTKRDMIASVSVTLEEMEQILEYMRKTINPEV